jgi:ribonuclease R
MAKFHRSEGKSKHRGDAAPARRTEGPPARRFEGRPAQRLPEGPSAEALIKALAGQETGATASQLAMVMQADARSVSITLKRLVEQGQVLEVRPGRYRASGSGGEHSAIVVEQDGTQFAKTGDGVFIPLHPRYRLGSRNGDVVQVLVASDGQALVTRVLRRGGRSVVGTVMFAPGGPRLIPDNRREGQMPVLTTYPKFHQEYTAGDRVVGTLEVDALGQAGVNIERILSEETPEVADFRHVCLVHDLPGEFPKDVERAAAGIGASFPLQGAREDIRQKQVFTIDPATAKDFDDALSLESRPEGGWILGVHIADVAHFVRQFAPIDTEAALRGTSVYLINRVIPMLPEKLSNGLCSLVPNEDRYCLTAWLELDRNCKLVGTRMAETLICSRNRFSYEEALSVLEGRDEPGKWSADIRETLLRVSSVAQRLRSERVRAGALNLFSQEHRFLLDVEGEPIEVEREGSDISHQLIEECMLLANRAVAAWLKGKGYDCVYRVHAEPNAEKLGAFATALENIGLDSKRVQAGRYGLQGCLRDLENQPTATRLVLNFLCLRAFSKAIYQVDNIGHHALAFDDYCHFTSPIRRYPDLLVHRLVKHALGLAGYKAVEIRRDYLDAMARQSTWLEQRSENAERDLFARKAARYLSRRIGEEVAGVITGASGGGAFVQMLETGIDGFLPMRAFTDDYYTFDDERLALVGRNSGRLIGPGFELTVRIDAVDIERGDIVLGFPKVEAAALPVTAPAGDGRQRPWKKRKPR